MHLWFLVMLLAVQGALPLSVRADRRLGLRAVGVLLAVAIAVELVRGGVTSTADLSQLGTLVTGTGGGIGWVNALVVWLLPQQLGIAWRRGRLGGARVGPGLLVLGLLWLAAGVAAGYPVAVVGGELDGSSNVLPPTLQLVGVMWVQVGAVLLAERPARRALGNRAVGKLVAILGALGMPLYLWHELAELPAAWLGERLGAQPGASLGVALVAVASCPFEHTGARASPCHLNHVRTACRRARRARRRARRRGRPAG